MNPFSYITVLHEKLSKSNSNIGSSKTDYTDINTKFNNNYMKLKQLIGEESDFEQKIKDLGIYTGKLQEILENIYSNNKI